MNHLPFCVKSNILQFFFQTIIVKVGRDIGKIWNIKVETEKDIKVQESRLKTWRNRWIYKSNTTDLQLDTPMKRFFVFGGYYLIFLAFLMVTILDHTKIELGKDGKISELLGGSETFSHGYIVLTIFAFSMLWEDLYSFLTHKAFFSYFKFWRVYDMVMHLGLTIALGLRGLRRISCFHGTGEEKRENPNVQCYNPELKRTGYEEQLLQAEALVFAVVTTAALLR